MKTRAVDGSSFTGSTVTAFRPRHDDSRTEPRRRPAPSLTLQAPPVPAGEPHRPEAPVAERRAQPRSIFPDSATAQKVLHDLLDEAGVRSYRIRSESGKGWCIFSVDQGRSGAWETFCFLVTEHRLMQATTRPSERRELLVSLALNLTVQQQA